MTSRRKQHGFAIVIWIYVNKPFEWRPFLCKYTLFYPQRVSHMYIVHICIMTDVNAASQNQHRVSKCHQSHFLLLEELLITCVCIQRDFTHSHAHTITYKINILLYILIKNVKNCNWNLRLLDQINTEQLKINNSKKKRQHKYTEVPEFLFLKSDWLKLFKGSGSATQPTTLIFTL